MGVARLLLCEQEGTSSHEHVSQTQAAALCELLQSCDGSLSAADRADLSQEVLTLKWHGADLTRLQAHLKPPPSGRITTPRRRSLQSYEAIVNYGTQAWWDFMMDDAPAQSKLDALIRRAILLGLRIPKEPTLKFMCSLWLLLQQSEQDSFASRLPRSTPTFCM